MKVLNVKYYTELDFTDYLALPGVSYSSIKGDVPASAGLTLGTQVHQYILEPKKYPWENVEQVKKIAAVLRQVVGPALQYLDKEVAFTADFHYNGLVMPYKGRTDLLKAGRIVVDLKVLAGALQPAIARFGYDRQVSGYCLATGSPTGLIISYNKQRKAAEWAVIKPNEEWWNYQIVQRCQIPV